MENKLKNINLRSEEIQDILGTPPGWLTRFGSLFILLALLTIVIVSAIVEYPDVIKTTVEISSSNPPISLFAKQAGNIEELAVSNNDDVLEGEILGILQNGANEKEVFLIEVKLDSFINYFNAEDTIVFPENVELGRIQESYANFLRSYEDYAFYDSQNTITSSISYIKNQINELNNITTGLKKQSQHCSEELELLNKKYFTDLELASKGFISQRVVDESMAVFTQKKSMCENLNIQVSNNQLKIQELEMQIFNFSSGDIEDIQSKSMLVKENASKLANDINLWKEQYLIISPVDGFVSLNQVWSNNQYLEVETEILSIVQIDNNLKVFAKVASKDIAKVKVGQQANIRLEAYYYMEYGLVQGTVNYISAVPRGNFYQVDITLNNGLTTTYDKELTFSQGMLGIAEIVSNKRTFIERILDKFKYLFSDH